MLWGYNILRIIRYIIDRLSIYDKLIMSILFSFNLISLFEKFMIYKFLNSYPIIFFSQSALN